MDVDRAQTLRMQHACVRVAREAWVMCREETGMQMDPAIYAVYT